METKAQKFNHRNSSLYLLPLNFFIFFGFACFTLSLFMIVFYTNAEDIFGYWVLVTGWIGIVFIQLAWFANPINLLALLIIREHPRTAVLLSFLALVLASNAYQFHEIPIDVNQNKIFVKEFGLGFYTWYIAQCLFFLAFFTHFLATLKRS